MCVRTAAHVPLPAVPGRARHCPISSGARRSLRSPTSAPPPSTRTRYAIGVDVNTQDAAFAVRDTRRVAHQRRQDGTAPVTPLSQMQPGLPSLPHPTAPPLPVPPPPRRFWLTASPRASRYTTPAEVNLRGGDLALTSEPHDL
eukprot:363288-Chlamydomonas_euryale.AAC.4